MSPKHLAHDRPIERLVAALRYRLPPGRQSRDVLAEVRDGLEDAAEAYRSGGLRQHEAEQRAVADFGDLDQVGQALRTEIGAAAGFFAQEGKVTR